MRKVKIAALTFAVVVIGALAVLGRPNIMAVTVAGCYELSMGTWKPYIALGEDQIFITPPARIKLSLEPSPTHWMEGALLIKPALGAKQSIHNAAEWKYDDSAVHLLWSTGFSGVSMVLKPHGSRLEGRAESFWDFPRQTQTSAVVASRVPCFK